MRRPTGSKLPLTMKCPASMALPWIDEPPGPAAIRGTHIHEFLERIARYRGDADIAPEDVVSLALHDTMEDAPLEVMPYLRALDLEKLARYTDLQPEAAFALDWRNRKARHLGNGLGRAYPALGPTEIALTIDVLGVGEKRVRVSDYKTGRGRYGPADEFPQLLAAAAAACWTFGKDEAIVELVYLDEHGEAWPSSGVVDGWAIDAFAADIERAMDQLGEAQVTVSLGGMPDVRPGPHCVDMYCPAYRACPAKSALVRHMPEHVAEVQRPGYLAPERLTRTWHQLQEAKKILGVIEGEIRELSIREPIDLGDGYVLGPRERRVESVDGTVTRNVLTTMLGASEYADKATSLEATKAGIEEAARLWRDRNPKDEDGKRVVLKHLLDRILDEIRRQGGATVKVTNGPTVYKARKELPP